MPECRPLAEAIFLYKSPEGFQLLRSDTELSGEKGGDSTAVPGSELQPPPDRIKFDSRGLRHTSQRHALDEELKRFPYFFIG